MKSKSSLNRRVQIELGFAILVLLVMGAISYRSMLASSESIRWVRHTYETIENLQDLLLAMESIESSYRGFVLTGKESYLAPYRSSISSAGQDEAALHSLTVDNPEQQRRLTALETKVAEKIQFAEGLIGVRRDQGSAAASQLMGHDDGLRLMNEIRDLTTGMETEERSLLETRSALYQASANKTKWTIRLGWLLALGFLVAATRIVHHDIAKLQRVGEINQAQAALLDSVHDAILVRNPADEITFWNNGAVTTYGWTREEIVGRSPHDLLQTRFPKPLKEIKAELAERGGWEGELTHVCKNGREIVVDSRWVVNRDLTGRLSGTLEINRDITQRKRAEEALARLAAIVESSDDAILSKSLDGVIQSWNSGAERLYGYSATEAVGQSVSIITPPGGDEGVHAILKRIGKGERVQRSETQRVRKDGRLVDVSLTVSPIKDSAGKVVGASTIGRDITDQKRTEVEIKALNTTLGERMAELEAANHELEAFTYSVSHDLRSPLRHLSGFSKILREEYGPRLDQTAIHYLQRISDATTQMGNLVDDLLNLSRLGRRELNRQPSALNSLVEEVLANRSQEIAGRDIEWRIGQLPFADCDPPLMKQVFDNLLANALKFSRPRHPAVIEVGQVSLAGETVIYVRDNGVGFSMKYAGKLFGVFQRLHRAEDFEGTGVGLATAQRIVHKHGGRIWAEAELDKGATFYFTLGPATQPEEQTATAGSVKGDI